MGFLQGLYGAEGSAFVGQGLTKTGFKPKRFRVGLGISDFR